MTKEEVLFNEIIFDSNMTTDDIRRLNYIKYTSFRELINKPHCIIYCLCYFILQVFWFCINRRKGSLSTKNILFVVPSLNNQKSVKTIISGLPKEKCTIWGQNLPSIFPYMEIGVMSLMYLHLFVKLYLESSKEDRRLIRFYSWDFLTTCATYKVFERVLLQNPNLKIVVMANDHVLITRCLIELTEKHHIKSLYVQHASVTKKFPPLRFDYSFLDGLESYEKYKVVGNMRGHIFLSGSPRFDAFHNYQVGNRKYDIGIALNELDSEDQALELCLYLKKKLSSVIIVRPHPGMLVPNNLLFHEEKFTKHGFSVSDPKNDLSYVFLSSIKVMVANESGIHLDAALMGIPSLLYNFSGNDVMDWYSYIKKGLIKKCDTYEDVICMLGSEYHLPVDVVRYYAASFMTPRDGKVGEMIAEFINKEVFESEKSAFKYMESIMVNQGEYAEYRN